MTPALYAGAAALAIGFGSGWAVQGWRWDAADLQRVEQDAKERARVLDRAHTASAGYETTKAKNEIVYKTVTVTAREFIDRPVYLNQCMDDDGLRAINGQIAGATDPGKPSATLPKP